MSDALYHFQVATYGCASCWRELPDGSEQELVLDFSVDWNHDEAPADLDITSVTPQVSLTKEELACAEAKLVPLYYEWLREQDAEARVEAML